MMEPTPSFSLNGKQIWHTELGSQKPFRNILSMSMVSLPLHRFDHLNLIYCRVDDATVVVSELLHQVKEVLDIQLGQQGEERVWISAVSIPFPISTRRLEIEMLAAVEGLSLWDDRTGFSSAILETRQILWCAYGLSQSQGLGVEGMVDESGEGAGVVVHIEIIGCVLVYRFWVLKRELYGSLERICGWI